MLIWLICKRFFTRKTLICIIIRHSHKFVDKFKYKAFGAPMFLTV